MRFYRVLHDYCLNKYHFDVDFYKPKSKLTLLHVVAKYTSLNEWNEEEKENLKALVIKCSNLTLRNNHGFTVLDTLKNCKADDKNHDLMKSWMYLAIAERTKGLVYLLEERRKRSDPGRALPNRFVIRDIMKYVD